MSPLHRKLVARSHASIVSATIGQTADRVIHMRDGQVQTIVENETRMDPEELEW